MASTSGSSCPTGRSWWAAAATARWRRSGPHRTSRRWSSRTTSTASCASASRCARRSRTAGQQRSRTRGPGSRCWKKCAPASGRSAAIAAPATCSGRCAGARPRAPPAASGRSCSRSSPHDVPVLKHTPFHERTAALCLGQAWRRWAGHVVASSYDLVHDREYHAIRSSAALLDVSPLYKYLVGGRDAARLLDRVVTRNVARLQVGQVAYTTWCDSAGKVIDDGTV